ncbi:MAG: bifunctional UDP-N-acetylglucosamine diphosphorylase/glucosamine-1-phosphate N-acetyltransferase GlmU [Archangium sp.]|nr:bifunctional UDP-N-acetylglucosamine diphosphorylase/glucosamine-1-phosphate N-acetyltransferase GlmU [Archangium sp.]
MTQALAAVVLCAGKGTRMKSETTPKVLHTLLGRPMAWYPMTRAFEIGASPVVAVIGHHGEAVQSALGNAFSGNPVAFATQSQQRGTGDAAAAARTALAGFNGKVLILSGDVPLVTAETLKRLHDAAKAAPGPLAMLTCRPPSPTGYGRIIRDGAQRVVSIVEERDATPAQREVREVNAGLYLVDSTFLWGALEKLTPQNAQGELYLTDIVAAAAKVGTVTAVEADAAELAGINDRVELAERTEVLRARINRRHQLAGVTLQHPASTFIDEGVEIGPDTIIAPNVTISGECEIGARVHVDSGCVLVHSTVGDDSHVKPYSVLEEAVVGPACHVGPFARLRPGTVLDEGVHIGNFVETKKARLKKGSKAGHLAYLGDAEIGANCNIGAGTITCNYDGVNKHQTVLGDGVFIGSDTQLVAPVTVGDGAFVAAGSTITKNVPSNALALSRTPQTVRANWAESRRAAQKRLSQG